jgi:glycosyltransferase involved in cell wall biosynthesis
VRVVATVHNARPHGGEPLRWPGGGALPGPADAWVVHSEATAKELLADRPELGSRVRLVRPGIESGARESDVGPGEAGARLAARRRLSLDADAPLALFAGLIRPYKGLDLLLEAFARVRVPEARLVVAGLPRPSFRGHARRIDRLGLRERVTTDLRYLPQTVMDDYLTAADLVVLPYRDASQSAVLGAALDRDRAVVASAAGGLPEMLDGTGEEMLVPVGDVAALAEAIGRLLGERATASEHGRRAGRAARERFSWPQAAAATAELYRELAPAGEAR